MSSLKCEKCKREFKVNRSSKSHVVYCPYCDAENHMFWTTGDIAKGVAKGLARLLTRI